MYNVEDTATLVNRPMYPQADEPKLLRRASQGDRDALAELYRRYVDAVYRYMYYRVRDHLLAEDLTAEVFAQVLRSISRYEERGLPFGAWLFRIAQACLVDHFRRDRVRATVELDEEAPALTDSEPSPDRVLDELDFVALLQHLTDEQRQVVLLRFVGGLSNAEIAEVTDSNTNAVKALMFRALHRLKSSLSRAETGQ